MGLFAKTIARKKSNNSAAKAASYTMWVVADGDPASASLDDLIQLTAKAKVVGAQIDVRKDEVKDYAERRYVEDYVSSGVPPATPMIVQNSSGSKIVFVVQDRSGQYDVKEDQQIMLAELLGQGANDLLYTETTFGFNRDILAMPGVQDVIEGALERALKKLVSEDILSIDNAGALLCVDVKTAFKPGTLDRLCQICSNSATTMLQFLRIMGSSATRYVKT